MASFTTFLLRTGSLFAFVILLYPTCYGQSGDSVFDQTYAFDPGDDLSVSTSSSDIILRPGAGNEARVEVFGKGRNLEEAFQRLNFRVEREGGGLVVKTERDGGWFRGHNGTSFDIVITAPASLNLSVATSSGDVQIQQLEGDLSIATSSGDIMIGSARGPISIATSSGDVEADRLEGVVEFSTSSGDFEVDAIRGAQVSFASSSGDFQAGQVDVDRFEASSSSGDIAVRSLVGDAEVSTSSGDIELREFEGALSASTSSGDVHAGLVKPGAVDVSTGSGEVRLSAPAALAANLDLRGGSIRIGRDFAFVGDVERRSVEGQVGGGGPLMKVRTGSGSVSLSVR